MQVLSAESAKFTLAYSGVGLSPDGSSSYYLPRLVGLHCAQELMITNRVLSADEAQQMGLMPLFISAQQNTNKTPESRVAYAEVARWYF